MPKEKIKYDSEANEWKVQNDLPEQNSIHEELQLEEINDDVFELENVQSDDFRPPGFFGSKIRSFMGWFRKQEPIYEGSIAARKSDAAYSSTAELPILSLKSQTGGTALAKS